jgi:thiosulfate reductase cytochrome b subunit
MNILGLMDNPNEHTVYIHNFYECAVYYYLMALVTHRFRRKLRGKMEIMIKAYELINPLIK